MMMLKRRCIILENETGKVYVVDGKVHREDGPAIECKNGNKGWFLKGQQVSQETHELNTRYKTIIVDDKNWTSNRWGEYHLSRLVSKLKRTLW